MSADAPFRVPRLEVELTSACDQHCRHCYNVWRSPAGGAPAGRMRGQLGTAETLRLIEGAVSASGAGQVTLTGGEPLLRPDAVEIVEQVCALVERVQLVTNAGRLTPAVAARLGRAGLRSAQVTLLSADRARHDARKGAESFDQTLRAVLDLRDAGVGVQVCFVATRESWSDLDGVLELCLALGVRSLSYNRMSPAGAAVAELGCLLPEVGHVEANLESLERLGRRWGMAIATAMPIPPCLVRHERYPSVRFAFCSAGSSTPSPVLDALGNVRSCNLSPVVLGNLRERSWEEVVEPLRRLSVRPLPGPCVDCAYAGSCRGGCPEAALAAFGPGGHPDPFVRLATDPAWRRELGLEAGQ